MTSPILSQLLFRLLLVYLLLPPFIPYPCVHSPTVIEYLLHRPVLGEEDTRRITDTLTFLPKRLSIQTECEDNHRPCSVCWWLRGSRVPEVHVGHVGWNKMEGFLEEAIPMPSCE